MAVKLILLPQNVPLGKIYDPMGRVFSILPLFACKFLQKFSLILLFFSSFFGQISCKIIKNDSLFKKSTLLWEYIFFYLLRFVVLEIFDFKVFDFIEKMNENATLNFNISKLYKVEDKKIYILIEQSKLY